MKIKIVKGSYNNGKEVFGPGKTLDVDNEEAAPLIDLGIAKKIGNTTKQDKTKEVLLKESGGAQ